MVGMDYQGLGEVDDGKVEAFGDPTQRPLLVHRREVYAKGLARPDVVAYDDQDAK